MGVYKSLHVPVHKNSAHVFFYVEKKVSIAYRYIMRSVVTVVPEASI